MKYIVIDNLDKVIDEVLKENERLKTNPSMVKDENSGIVFKDGKPHMIIDNEYVPYDKAKIIFQKRKVVREYLILKSMLK